MIASHELARVLAERLLNGIAEGIVIAVFAAVLLRFARRRNSSTRFAVWFSTLLVIAVLPFLGGLAPHPAGGGARATTSALTLPGSWATGIFLAWAFGATVALLPVLLGLWQLRGLRAGSITVDPSTLDPRLQKTLQECRSRKVTLAVCERVRVPTAVGFLRPLIVFPAWAMQELSAEELDSILIHELAHLSRRDDWTNLAQEVMRALWFFHPAVWWVESRLSLEREMACDDAVLAKLSNPRGYADCLVSLAEKSFLRRGLVMAQAAVHKMQQTSRRVLQILDPDRSVSTGVWRPALGLVTVFAALCLVTLRHAPSLVAFRDPTPRVNIASASLASRLPSLANSTKPVTFPSDRRSIDATPLPPKPILARQNVRPAQNRAGTLKAKLTLPDAGAATSQAAEESLRGRIAEQTVFVVMQGSDYGPAGPAVWTICVWRVTVHNPATPHISAAGVPAKSI